MILDIEYDGTNFNVPNLDFVENLSSESHIDINLHCSHPFEGTVNDVIKAVFLRFEEWTSQRFYLQWTVMMDVKTETNSSGKPLVTSLLFRANLCQMG